MGSDKKNIAAFIEQLLNKDDGFCKKSLNAYFDNPGGLLGADSHGEFVDETLLLKLIQKSLRSSCLRTFIAEIFPMLDERSITDRVFHACVEYPVLSYRKTLYIQLAHMWLTVDQLMLLNERLDTPEAYIKIINTMIRERYTLSAFRAFLAINSRFSNSLPYCKAQLLREYGVRNCSDREIEEYLALIDNGDGLCGEKSSSRK